MRAILSGVVRFHAAFFGRIEAMLASWLPALFARLAFGVVLAGYYWQSALGRFAEGLAAPLRLNEAAYAEVLPLVAQAHAAVGDPVPTLPWALVVALVSWAEIILPGLILVGLATRVAALAMVLVVLAGGVTQRLQAGVSPLPGALGGLFDADPSGFLDQRLLWLVPLMALMIRGAGQVSLDRLFGPRLLAMAGKHP
jgi:putative oxidoreductase